MQNKRRKVQKTRTFDLGHPKAAGGQVKDRPMRSSSNRPGAATTSVRRGGVGASATSGHGYKSTAGPHQGGTTAAGSKASAAEACRRLDVLHSRPAAKGGSDTPLQFYHSYTCSESKNARKSAKYQPQPHFKCTTQAVHNIEARDGKQAKADSRSRQKSK